MPRKKSKHMSLGANRVPLFPEIDPEKEVSPSNIRLPKWLWARLDEIAKSERRSRNAVVEYFLEWAVGDYTALKAKYPKK